MVPPPLAPVAFFFFVDRFTGCLGLRIAVVLAFVSPLARRVFESDL